MKGARNLCNYSSDSTGNVDISQLEPGQKPWPRVTDCAKRLKCQERLIFVFVFFIPSDFKWQQGSARKPGGAEVFQVSPGWVSVGRQRDVCWALQQHYNEADPNFPVSTASAALGKRGSVHPSPIVYRHYHQYQSA